MFSVLLVSNTTACVETGNSRIQLPCHNASCHVVSDQFRLREVVKLILRAQACTASTLIDIFNETFARLSGVKDGYFQPSNSTRRSDKMWDL